jgi:hypothetical protein
MADALSKPNRNPIWPTGLVKVEPVKRNVARNVRDSLIFSHHHRSLVKNAAVHNDLHMTRGHHRTCEARDSQEDLLSERLDAPREGEIHMESRETRLKHSFMLPMPVKRTFCPVLVAVEDVWHTVVVGAVNPLANLRVDLVNTDILKH